MNRNLVSNFSRKGLLAALVMVAAAGAQAAAVDVTGVVTEIGAQVTPIGLIGAAILLVVVAVAAFKWVRRGIS